MTPRFQSLKNRAETRDIDAPKNGKEKSARIDLGLAILSTVAVPGVCYTRDEIAAFCGCTHEGIRRIEERALRKLNASSRNSQILREALEHFSR